VCLETRWRLVVHFSSGGGVKGAKHPVEVGVGGRCSIKISESAGSYAHDPRVEERTHITETWAGYSVCQHTGVVGADRHCCHSPKARTIGGERAAVEVLEAADRKGTGSRRGWCCTGESVCI